MKFRMFTNDVARNRYSALRDCEANTPSAALKKTAVGLPAGTKLLALPYSRPDLWPDRTTGRIPPNMPGRFQAWIAKE